MFLPTGRTIRRAIMASPLPAKAVGGGGDTIHRARGPVYQQWAHGWWGGTEGANTASAMGTTYTGMNDVTPGLVPECRVACRSRVVSLDFLFLFSRFAEKPRKQQ